MLIFMIEKPVAGSVSKQRFFSEREIAETLGLSIKTIQGWRFRRSLGPPWKRLQGSVRYPADQFEIWWQAQPGGGGLYE
jgi:hypothetical protein